SRVASQAIFSEEVRVLEEQGDWVKIETIIDSYQGWIKKETCAAVEKLPKKTVMIDRIAAHLYHVTDTEFGPIMTLPFESRLELIEELPDSDRRWLKVKLPNNKEAFVQRGDCLLIPQKLTREQMVAFSKYFLGLPYTWGGRSSFGYDCSAFVQMLYRQMGVYIPRDSKDQIKWDGFQSIEMNELQPGDLIFWGKSAQKINHVGMYLGEGKFIHTIASVEKKPYLRISSVNDPAWDAKPTNYHAFRAAKTLKG
ncbi:MAG TPA: C40 family peptidase, partial [Chlamydiales bacterium]|nr:C40 family peptidase [Chlamydiales bacterium]